MTAAIRVSRKRMDRNETRVWRGWVRCVHCHSLALRCSFIKGRKSCDQCVSQPPVFPGWHAGHDCGGHRQCQRSILITPYHTRPSQPLRCTLRPFSPRSAPCGLISVSPWRGSRWTPSRAGPHDPVPRISVRLLHPRHRHGHVHHDRELRGAAEPS